MRRKRLLIMMAVAVLSGLAAAYVAMDYLASQRPVAITPQRASAKVAVAVRDLPLGAIVQMEDVRLIDWPGEVVPAGFVTTAEGVVGRGLIRPISMNEPYLETKLADRSAGGGLPIVIPEGMRAVSVRVDEVIGVAGFVLPGTRVDVLTTISPPGETREKMTRLILQNIQVLTAGQMIEQTPEGKPMTVTVITLMVTPEQAETLTLAATEGRIQLALRGVLDLEEVTTPGSRVANLLGPAPAARSGTVRRVTRVAPRSETGPTVVETFKGGVRTLTTFNND